MLVRRPVIHTKIHRLYSIDATSSISFHPVSSLILALICPCSGSTPKGISFPGPAELLVLVLNVALVGKTYTDSTSSKADATFLKSVGGPIISLDGRTGLSSVDWLERLPDRLRFQSALRQGRFAQMTDAQASSPDHMTIPMSAPSAC